MKNKFVRFFASALVTSLFIGITSSCHHYAGTGKLKETVVMSYGNGTIKPPVAKTPDGKIKPFFVEKISGVIIGYVVKYVSKEVEERRDGDFKIVNADIRADRAFPSNGFVVVMRMVHDKDGKYPDVAGIDDFVNNRNGTVAAQLLDQISSPRETTSFRVTEQQLISAVEKSLSGVKYDARHKIAYLAICPLFPIDNRPNGSEALYAVGFEGAYYPLFKGYRFVFERQGLVRKYTDSKEVMSIELYGPQGSGFSTGLIPIPVLWMPPSSGRMWVTADQLIKDLPEDQQKKMKSILDLSYKNSNNRGTFVNARPGIIPLLKGDAYIDESGKGTKLLNKGIEKLPDVIEQ